MTKRERSYKARKRVWQQKEKDIRFDKELEEIIYGGRLNLRPSSLREKLTKEKLWEMAAAFSMAAGKVPPMLAPRDLFGKMEIPPRVSPFAIWKRI